ncbi:MAG: hypothetical protein JWP58_2004 [Hymenobacter sp.]|nr:hypothetical protein [Hymenobacter sp.]
MKKARLYSESGLFAFDKLSDCAAVAPLSCGEGLGVRSRRLGLPRTQAATREGSTATACRPRYCAMLLARIICKA